MLTPASTTVSDEGELSPQSNDTTTSTPTDTNDTTSSPTRDVENGDNAVEAAPDATSRFDWTTTAFGRSQGLLAQVGSLSKELTELKAMIARGVPPDSSQAEVRISRKPPLPIPIPLPLPILLPEPAVVLLVLASFVLYVSVSYTLSPPYPGRKKLNPATQDLTRVKANHRSSLTSLAESHRTEIATLATSHAAELARLEAAHVAEMRTARQGYGFRDELVRGLRDSYGRQIESLVLDLNEAQRQLKAAKEEEEGGRTLDMVLRFDDLDKAFSVCEVSIPHPGRSFQTVWEHVCAAVKSYIGALNAAAGFWAEEGEVEARKIRYWYRSEGEKRIRFRFLHGSEGDNMSDLWEGGLWRNDSFTLRVLCAVEPWEGVPVFNDEDGYSPELQQESTSQRLKPAGTGASRSRTPLAQVPEEQLVQVETPRAADGFNVSAALDNINRELRELEINERIAELDVSELEDDDENKENIEHPIPKRKVTVEEVTDEEDHFRDDPEDEGVGLAISSSPVPATSMEKEPLLPRGSSSRRSTGRPLGDRTFMDNLLGTEAEMKKQEGKTTGGSSGSDSWLFDELFSPLPADKGKGKEKAVGGLFEGLFLFATRESLRDYADV